MAKLLLLGFMHGVGGTLMYDGQKVITMAVFSEGKNFLWKSLVFSTGLFGVTY